MYCKKCGSKNDSDAMFCASCGETALSEQTNLIAIKNKNGKLNIIVVVLSVLLIVLISGMFQLTKEEKMALGAAKAVQELMYSPESLDLYDDEFFVYKEFGEDGKFKRHLVVFKFSGTNKFGEDVTDYAMFSDDKYLLNLSDAKNVGKIKQNDYVNEIGWSDYYEENLVLLQEFEEIGSLKNDEMFRTAVKINVPKVKEKLGLN